MYISNYPLSAIKRPYLPEGNLSWPVERICVDLQDSRETSLSRSGAACAIGF